MSLHSLHGQLGLDAALESQHEHHCVGMDLPALYNVRLGMLVTQEISLVDIFLDIVTNTSFTAVFRLGPSNFYSVIYECNFTHV